MIYDSEPYKNELGSIAKYLRKIFNFNRNITFFQIEKRFFLSGYYIRKLIEAKNKLTTSLVKTNIALEKFPSIKPHGMPHNRNDIEKHYNLEEGKNVNISLLDFTHLIIHSYVFTFSISDDNTIEGFFFVSDRYKDEFVYYIGVEKFCNLLERISDNYPDKIYMKIIEKKGKSELIVHCE